MIFYVPRDNSRDKKKQTHNIHAVSLANEKGTKNPQIKNKISYREFPWLNLVLKEISARI